MFVCFEIKCEVHLFQRNKHQKIILEPLKLRWPIYIALFMLVSIVGKDRLKIKCNIDYYKEMAIMLLYFM